MHRSPSPIISGLAVTLCCVLSIACSTGRGRFPADSTTQTELSQANFRVLQSNARGHDRGFYLFGILPIVTPSYGDAMSDLRTHVETKGKATALANVTEDSSMMFLLLFSLPRITITADVIEFLPDDDQQEAETPPARSAPVAQRPSSEADSGVHEYCVTASPGLNSYGGKPHALPVLLVQLSDVSGFLEAKPSDLLSDTPAVPGVLGGATLHTAYPDATSNLQVKAHTQARYLGVLAQYKQLKGSGRGYRAIAESGQGATCIHLGPNGIENP